MSTLLIEQLQNVGFIKGSKANLDKVHQTPLKRLLEISEETAELTSAEKLKSEQSAFSHSATLSLGGGKEPCINLDCRKKHSASLAQFSALYSDRVYIYNFLAEYAVHGERHRQYSEDQLRREFADDIAVLAQVQPLIESGNIVPITPSRNFCPRCFSDLSLGEDTDNNFDRAERDLVKLCEKQLEVTFTNLGRAFALGARGPESLIEHGFRGQISTVPPSKSKLLPRSLKCLPVGDQRPVSKQTLRRLGFYTELAGDILRNVRFELAMSRCINTRFLTDQEIHVELLRNLSGDKDLIRRDEIIQEHLSCLVPFVDCVSTSDLLSLRKKEPEAFILFRAALARAIGEYQKSRKQFTKKDAQQIYGDILAPQLAKLDAKIRHAQQKLRISTIKKGLAWAGVVSFGVYSGIVPANLHTAALALGLAKPAADLIESLISHSETDASIRGEEIYFLWKVRNMSTRNQKPSSNFV